MVKNLILPQVSMESGEGFLSQCRGACPQTFSWGLRPPNPLVLTPFSVYAAVAIEHNTFYIRAVGPTKFSVQSMATPPQTKFECAPLRICMRKQHFES